MRTRLLLALAASAAIPAALAAQTPTPDNAAIATAVKGLGLRTLGPGLMSGRIADIAVHPTDRSTWYVAAGSGGVWKTGNAGVTWTPLFDEQPSYSIGEITLDPTNPEVVWVGTGENVSGRHVGWGDGVYRSRDGGKTWQRMGLSGSQHIGRILVHPKDGNVVLVAAEGPLWSAGGERGVYRTEDGGAHLEGRAPDRREHRRHRPRVRSVEPRGGVCRRLPAPPSRGRLPLRRAQVGPLEILRQRPDVASGHHRPSQGRHGEDRAGGDAGRPEPGVCHHRSHRR